MKVKVVVLALLVSVLLSVTASAGMLWTDRDTFGDRFDTPNAPIGENLINSLQVRNALWANNGGRKTYIHFNISSITDPVGTASLDLILVDEGLEAAEAANIAVYVLNDGDSGEGWSESTLTWNNAPANNITSDYALLGNASLIDTFWVHDGDAVGWPTISVSNAALVNALNADTDGSITFILTILDGIEGSGVIGGVNYDYIAFASRERADSDSTTLSFTTVPEPATIGLLGIGLMALMRRRK